MTDLYATLGIPRLAIVAAMLLTTPAAAHAQPVFSLCFTTGGDTAHGEDCAGRVVSEVNRAKQSIDVFAYELTEPRIASALSRAHIRGVAVRIIADRAFASSKLAGHLAWLAFDKEDGGIPVYIDGVPGLEHNKVIIIDGQTVLTGSLNWTKAANERNAENLVIIRDPGIAGLYEGNFLQRLADSEPWK